MMLRIAAWIGIFWIGLVLAETVEGTFNTTDNDKILIEFTNESRRLPRESRVLNGVDTEPGNYPFIVSLRRKGGQHFCAGSIINTLWLLTAAHCVAGINMRNVQARYGMFDLRSNSQGFVDIERKIVHKDYSPSRNWANDIALLKIVHRLRYIPGRVEAVTLPNKDFEVPNYLRATLIGWGQDTTGYQQNHLKEADLFVLSDRDCYARHNGKTTSNQICGTLIRGGSIQCNGDSGGPLLFNGRIQVGIVSWSVRPCGRPPYPGVYTKVSHYLDFLAFHINSI